jgi:hypothetical protein
MLQRFYAGNVLDSVDRKLGFCAVRNTTQKSKTLLFPALCAGKSSVLGAVY